MFEGFPYTNFHELNLDWIVKIAKDFLDQYTHIQELIETGEASITELTESGELSITNLTTEKLAALQTKAENLEALLQAWYNTHSADIANQLTQATADFASYATTKGNEVIASIPDDYSLLSAEVAGIDEKLYGDGFKTFPIDTFATASQGAFITTTPVGQTIITQAGAGHEIKYTDDVKHLRRITINLSGSAGGQPIITLVNKSNASVLAQGYANPSTNKMVFWIPNGLPDNTRLLINDFNYIGDTRLISNVIFEYEQIDYKIVTSRNKINQNAWGVGDGYFYTGAKGENSSIISFAFPVSAGDTLRLRGISPHITFWKDVQTFVSGTLDTTCTVPATATFVIISSTGTEPSTPVATLNDEDVSYVPFTYKFRNDTQTATGKQYRAYTPGQIHFTVPVNQTIINDVTTGSGDSADSENIVNVNAVLRLPSSYEQFGKPVPVIMIFHGSGFAVNNSAWGYNDGQGGIATSIPFNSLIDEFVSGGYAVCDINGYNNDIPNGTWGCTKCVNAHMKLYEYVTSYYNVENMINVYGFSMGGIDALNFVRNNKGIVKALALGDPVIYLFDQVYSGAAHWKQLMAIGFGFWNATSITYTDGAPTTEEMAIWNDTYNTKLRKGYAPEDDIITFNNVEKCIKTMPPTRAWQGYNDTVVSQAMTGKYITALQNGGSYAHLRLMNGVGHEICYGESAIVNTEIVYWFNRFNK